MVVVLKAYYHLDSLLDSLPGNQQVVQQALLDSLLDSLPGNQQVVQQVLLDSLLDTLLVNLLCNPLTSQPVSLLRSLLVNHRGNPLDFPLDSPRGTQAVTLQHSPRGNHRESLQRSHHALRAVPHLCNLAHSHQASLAQDLRKYVRLGDTLRIASQVIG